MKYSLKNPAEKERAFAYLTELADKGVVAEIKRVQPKRSLNQNSFLHLLLGAFGSHFGYTMEEAKLIYKELSPHIYKYEKKGRTFWRSSADLTKEEMTITIERLREASEKQDYPLPRADDIQWINSLENTIEMNQRYL